jgi:hypothetical protein
VDAGDRFRQFYAMPQQSLFGHLIGRFSTQPENLATESLNYILNRSVVARRAFLRYLAQVGIEAADLSFQTQAGGSDNAIPDLVGTDAAGQPVVIVEAKFWAGLTPNQPVTYLQRLPDDAPSVVLFLAPAMRFATLWPELLQRCKLSGMTVGPERRFSRDFVATGTGPRRVLALASWRGVLTIIGQPLQDEGETEAASDVLQLRGLSERMDDEAFLPLRSEEVTADTGRRIVQFSEILDEVTDRAVAEGLVSIARQRATGGRTWYGRYMRIHGWGCLLHWDASKWSRERATPIWLNVRDADWKTTLAIRDHLSVLEFENPSRLLLVEGQYSIPFRLPLGVEKGGVVDSLLGQLREVADLIGRGRASATQELRSSASTKR